jgi:lipopolysaccharide biosynthesis glycosyltransferase
LKNIYHIAFAIEDEYAQHLGVAIASIISNNKSAIQFHVVSENLSESNKRFLRKLLRSDRYQICFYTLDAISTELFKIDGHAKLANYYRLFLPTLLSTSIHKVLYLDSDLVVLKCLDELWNIDLSNQAAAVVAKRNEERSQSLGLQDEDYFNSGVMMMNLDYFREHNLLQKCESFMMKFPELIRFWDQDVLNVVLSKRLAYLPEKFNQAQVVKHDTVIVHFLGSLKPWSPWYSDKNRWYYFKYLIKTDRFVPFTIKFIFDYLKIKFSHFENFGKVQ